MTVATISISPGNQDGPGGDFRTRFPRRTVHLDFHTGPDIPAVGARFDADAFARTFRDAHVDSVTVFAKCHHGLLYYRTGRPERHPGLDAGLDLLGEQIQALHGAGIRAPIYLSVQCDEHAANLHPDWLALTPELRQVRRPPVGAFEAGWQILDMSSPYTDYLAEQLEEVLQLYGPVDGIFLDMCWDQPSVSHWALDSMRREGLDPQDPADRDRHARLVAHRFMARYADMVDAAVVDGSPQAAWFNSRPKAGLVEERRFVRHVEVEALPTGGWGYSYLPYVARLVRGLGLPTLSHTGRFHRSWGDMASLKPHAALKYECCQILAHGLTNGVGDLLAPDGVPNDAVYGIVGSVYAYIEACEPFVTGGRHLTDVTLLVDPERGDSPGDAVVGAVRLLQQLRQQFDVLPVEAPLDPRTVVIVPESTPVDDALCERLRAHVRSGGPLLIAASAIPAGDAGDTLLADLHVERHGVLEFDPVFLDMADTSNALTRGGIAIRIAGEAHRITPLAGCDVLLGLAEPYFQRSYEHFSGHSYTPPARSARCAAVLQAGKAVVTTVPLFTAAALEGNEEYRAVISSILDRLLARPLVRAGGPVHLETSVVGHESTTAVHLLSYLPSRLARDLDVVHDPFPLVDLDLQIRSDVRPTRVTRQPDGEELSFTYDNGYVTTMVSVPDGHAIVVLEE
ncbi:MAG: alpha-amylase family protein [Acidimicrobiales bacterium]